MWFAHARPELYSPVQPHPWHRARRPLEEDEDSHLVLHKQQQHPNSTQTFSNMFSSNLSLLCRRLHLPPPLHPPLPPRQALRTLAGARGSRNIGSDGIIMHQSGPILFIPFPGIPAPPLQQHCALHLIGGSTSGIADWLVLQV